MKLSIRIPLCLLTLLFVPGIAFSQAMEFRWIGAGTSGWDDETQDNLWSNLANWESRIHDPLDPPAWAAATALPSSIDLVTINLNGSFTPPEEGDRAVHVTDGATAASVVVTSAANNANRNLSINGNVTFGVFDLSAGAAGGAGENVVRLESGSVFTINGGNLTDPAINMGSVSRTYISGPGTIVIDSEQFRQSGNGDIGGAIYRWGENLSQISDSNATLRVDSGLLQLRSGVNYPANFEILLMNAASIVNAAGPGTLNLGNAHIIYENGGQIGNYTAKSFEVYRSSGGGGITLDQIGDITASGRHYDDDLERDFSFVGGRGAGQYNYNSQGYDIVLEDPEGGLLLGKGNGRIVFALQSTVNGDTNIDIAGDFYMVADARINMASGTSMNIAGDFINTATSFTTANMTLGAFIMDGAGTASNPQWIEVAGNDLGPTTGGHNNNFAIGSLTIGADADNPTYVQLRDLVDSGNEGPDALYIVSSLWINENSVLNLNDINLYVAGVLVTPESEGFGPGIIVIPEPATISTLLLSSLGLLWLLQRRRRA